MRFGFARLDFADGKCIIDLNDIDATGAIGLKNEFYISFKNEICPKSCSGGEISLYETKNDFKTYKITRSREKIVTIVL